MSAFFKPFPLKVNKLYLVLLAFRQECGNVNVYVLSNSPISYKLKFIFYCSNYNRNLYILFLIHSPNFFSIP